MPSTLIASSLSVSLVVSHNKYSSTKDEKLEISQRLDVKTSRNMTKNRKDRVHCVPSGRKRCRIDRRGSGKTHRLGEVASIHACPIVVPQTLYRTLSSSAAERKPKFKQGAYRRRMKRLVLLLLFILACGLVYRGSFQSKFVTDRMPNQTRVTRT